MSANNKVYIGDGVYAEFDGWGVWLKANGINNDDDKIYLEPEVLNALLKFLERFSE